MFHGYFVSPYSFKAFFFFFSLSFFSLDYREISSAK